MGSSGDISTLSEEDGFKDAAVLRQNMSERVYIESANVELNPQQLLEKLETDGCGAIVSFTGITRGMDEGEEVLRLEFDAWEGKLEQTLTELAQQAIKKFGIRSVAMSHRIGSVGPQEPIVSIHVGSPHRKEAFSACSWLIDELKAQAPLWKKEVKPSGETWKAGLG